MSATDARASGFPAVRTPRNQKCVVCTVCGRSFNLGRSTQKFCSPSCRKRAWDKKAVIKALRTQFNSFMDDLEAGL
jgi:hypothetical protein